MIRLSSVIDNLVDHPKVVVTLTDQDLPHLQEANDV